MLVAVAAVLRHEPIFTKPLGFVDGSASAVEQLAMQRTIGIPNPWHSVLIPKFCAAFFTRHQKELFHFCIRPFRFHVSGTQHAHFITNGCAAPLTFAPKSAADFRRECALTHSIAFGKNAQPAPERCRSERVWDFPTSILQRKICICAHECTACRSFEEKRVSDGSIDINVASHLSRFNIEASRCYQFSVMSYQ